MLVLGEPGVLASRSVESQALLACPRVTESKCALLAVDSVRLSSCCLLMSFLLVVFFAGERGGG